MQPTEEIESPNSLFGGTPTPQRQSKQLQRTLSGGKTQQAQTKLAVQAELAKFTRELNSSAKNLSKQNLSRQKKKHSMSVHEKHDECISHWPVVKGINQKGTWPQETALPSLISQSYTAAVPRSQLRQDGYASTIYGSKKGQTSDTLLQPVLQHSLELGKQQSLEQADFVMVKDKISKSQIRSRQQNFPSSPSLKSPNALRGGHRSYNNSSIKKTKQRKNSVFSIYSNVQSNGMQRSSVSKDSNGPVGRNQHLKLEKVKTDTEDQPDYMKASGSGSKNRKEMKKPRSNLDRYLTISALKMSEKEGVLRHQSKDELFQGSQRSINLSNNKMAATASPKPNKVGQRQSQLQQERQMRGRDGQNDRTTRNTMYIPSRQNDLLTFPQVENVGYESSNRASKVTLKTDEHVIPKRASNLSNNLNFESPKNDIEIKNVKKRESNLPQSGSDSIGTQQLNPIESPDVIINQPKAQVQKAPFNDQFDFDLNLRSNRIIETSNENSQSLDSRTSMKKRNESKDSRKSLDMFYKQQEEAFQQQQKAFLENIENTEKDKLQPSPRIGRPFPAQSFTAYHRAQLSNRNSCKNLNAIDFRRASVNVEGRFANSLTRQLQSFSGDKMMEDDIHNFIRGHREEIAKYEKQKAILEQQVELLTIQLHEASAREKNLKKTYSTMIQALQQNKVEQEHQLQILKKQSTFSTPNNSALPLEKKKTFISDIDQDLNASLGKLADLQRENENLFKKLQEKESLNLSQKLQLKTQDQLLLQKEEELVKLKYENLHFEKDLRKLKDKQDSENEKIENKQIAQLKKQISILEEDIERKVRYRTDEFSEKEKILNEKVIEYQKEIQSINKENDSLKKIIHQKDLSCLELEKHVHLQEHQLVNLTRDGDKYYNESQNQINQLKKQNDILLERVERYKLANSSRSKTKLSDHDKVDQPNVVSKIEEEEERSKSGLSEIKEIQQTEERDDREEENKFIMSANQSKNSNENSLVEESKNNQNNEQNNYSFGDLERLNILGTQYQQSVNPEEMQLDQQEMHVNQQNALNQENMELRYPQVKNMLRQLQQTTETAKQDMQNHINFHINIQEMSDGQTPKGRSRISTHKNSAQSHRANDKVKILEQAGHQRRGSQSFKKTRDLSSKSKSIYEKSQVGERPYKMNYWQKDESFKDDGSNSKEVANYLRRQVANYRSKFNKLLVSYNDLKSQSSKEIQRLKNIVSLEKNKRLQEQEDKLEKSSALMRELSDRDKRIIHLQNDLTNLKIESDLESINKSIINQTYYGTTSAIRENKMGQNMLSVNQSQQLYNLTAMQPDSYEKYGRTSSRQSKRRGSLRSSGSQHSVKMQKQKMLEQVGYGQNRKNSTVKQRMLKQSATAAILPSRDETKSQNSQRSNYSAKSKNQWTPSDVDRNDDYYSKVTKKKDNTALSDRKYDSAKKKAPLTNNLEKQHSRNNLGQILSHNEMVEKVQTPVILNTEMSESSQSLAFSSKYFDKNANTIKSMDQSNFMKYQFKKSLLQNKQSLPEQQNVIVEESQIEPGCSSSRILSCRADNRGEEVNLRAPEKQFSNGVSAPQRKQMPRQRQGSGDFTDRDKNVLLSNDTLGEDLKYYKNFNPQGTGSLEQVFSPITKKEESQSFHGDTDKFRISMRSANPLSAQPGALGVNPIPGMQKYESHPATSQTLKDYAHLKSLTERSPCKEDSYNDEEDNSEDKTEDDDVGEEVSNQLVHSTTQNEGSLMSPTEKKYLVPKINLQEIPELQDEDNRQAAHATAPAIQTPISSGSFSTTKHKLNNLKSNEKFAATQPNYIQNRPPQINFQAMDSNSNNQWHGEQQYQQPPSAASHNKFNMSAYSINNPLSALSKYDKRFAQQAQEQTQEGALSHFQKQVSTQRFPLQQSALLRQPNPYMQAAYSARQTNALGSPDGMNRSKPTQEQMRTPDKSSLQNLAGAGMRKLAMTGQQRSSQRNLAMSTANQAFSSQKSLQKLPGQAGSQPTKTLSSKQSPNRQTNQRAQVKPMNQYPPNVDWKR